MFKSLPRDFRKIQTGNRVAIPDEVIKILNWKVGDTILIEAYKGKIIIENLSNIKPIEERLP